MTESVSDILVARAHFDDGLKRPVMASLAVHVVIVVGLAVLPASWFAAKAPIKTISISLGSGALGPERKGLTATGGRKIDTVAEPVKKEPIVPVAPPKSVVPDPAAPVVKTPPKAATKPAPPPPIAPTSKPAVGAQISQGNSLVETGAKGLGVGLSSGGIGGIQTDADFCCREYLSEMMSAIAAVWQEKQGITADTTLDFTVEKNGTVTDVKVRQPSGYVQLDLAAQRALANVRLFPLPDKFPGQRLLISLKFPYIR
jgi:TonB family protein